MPRSTWMCESGQYTGKCRCREAHGCARAANALKHPFRDGTTHVLFEPLDFTAPAHPCARGISVSLHVMARLAALVPRPRTHLVRYHGLFAPNAKQRQHIVTGSGSMPAPDNGQGATTGDTREPKPSAQMSRMQRLGSGIVLRSTSPIPGVVRRVFDIDLRICSRCGGTVRVIAEITEPALIARILEHRDGRDDFSGKAPAAGARAPPAFSLH